MYCYKYSAILFPLNADYQNPNLICDQTFKEWEKLQSPHPIDRLFHKQARGQFGTYWSAWSSMALTNKWMVWALTPCGCSDNILLRHRFSRMQPPNSRNWQCRLQWAFFASFSSLRVSPIWYQMTQLWRYTNPLLEPIWLVNTNEVMNIQLCWTNQFVESNFWFT